MIWGDCSFKVSQASLTQQEFINSTAIPLVPAVLSKNFIFYCFFISVVMPLYGIYGKQKGNG
jgi:hypothetical protein